MGQEWRVEKTTRNKQKAENGTQRSEQSSTLSMQLLLSFSVFLFENLNFIPQNRSISTMVNLNENWNFY